MKTTFKILYTLNGSKKFTSGPGNFESIGAAAEYFTYSALGKAEGITSFAIVETKVKPDLNDGMYSAEYVKGMSPWLLKVKNEKPKTAEELAKAAGLKSFDYAVPMDWMMKGIKLTGLNMGIVVWSYDGPKGGIFGYPVALDDEGKKFLAAYDAAGKKLGYKHTYATGNTVA